MSDETVEPLLYSDNPKELAEALRLAYGEIVELGRQLKSLNDDFIKYVEISSNAIEATYEHVKARLQPWRNPYV